MRKARKCIYIILKNFRVENSPKMPRLLGAGEISRNSRVTPLRSVIRTPCALQASLQIYGRRMRTSACALHKPGRISAIPAKTKGTRVGAYCLGWDSWIRTSENARVKVWCLTAWLYPNIFMRQLLYHKLALMSRRIFAIFGSAGDFSSLSSFCLKKIFLFTQKALSKRQKYAKIRRM